MTPITTDPRLQATVREHRYPLLFTTISGAHLYGFPSADSDFDLRGVHILPLREIAGLSVGPETIDSTAMREGLEIDLVTYDVLKFLNLMLKKNGAVLEQIYSPLVVQTTPEHAELKEIARGCVTKYHAHHYLGFSETQWGLFHKENPRRVKPLLYVYRVLLTGIHLMRTGQVEANLLVLNEEFKLPYIDDLVKRKIEGAEESKLPDADLAFHQAEYQRLRGELKDASDASALPEAPSAKAQLHDLLLRLRKVG